MHADHNNYIRSMEANYDVFYVCTSSVRRYNFYVLRQTNQASQSQESLVKSEVKIMIHILDYY